MPAVQEVFFGACVSRFLIESAPNPNATTAIVAGKKSSFDN